LAYPAAAVIVGAAVIVRLSWTLHGLWPDFPAFLVRELWPVDKNDLAPLRIVPFFAAVVLVAILVPRDARFLASRAARPLVLCGQQSLEIFCLGILLSALGHFVLVEYRSTIPVELAVNAAGIVMMVLIARMIAWYRDMDRMPVRAGR
jgi:hypothetical protein